MGKTHPADLEVMEMEKILMAMMMTKMMTVVIIMKMTMMMTKMMTVMMESLDHFTTLT